MGRKAAGEFKPSIHPEDRGKPFRLNAKHCFLTYPKYTCDKKELYTFIDSKYKIKKILIAEETHEDGDKHMHAYIEFIKKVDIRHWDVFDINGHHCNIQVARKPIACVKYLEKEDKELFTYGSFEEFETIDNLFDLCRETGDEEVYIETCRKQKVSIH